MALSAAREEAAQTDSVWIGCYGDEGLRQHVDALAEAIGSNRSAVIRLVLRSTTLDGLLDAIRRGARDEQGTLGLPASMT